jgi:hypothetical protein
VGLVRVGAFNIEEPRGTNLLPVMWFGSCVVTQLKVEEFMVDGRGKKVGPP